MKSFPKIVTLCGSSKFKEEFAQVQKELSLKGYIVISLGFFSQAGDISNLTNEQIEMLNENHRRKIDLADEIFVVNVNGYIGESTKSEIEYANEHNKIVNYLNPIN